MSKPSLVIVLVEDEHHKRIIYSWLTKCGVGNHAIRLVISPSGRGSADNWVRRRFAVEVSECRKRHAQTSLIVIMDADTLSVQERHGQLDQALKDAGKNPIDTTAERIARLVPKQTGMGETPSPRSLPFAALARCSIESASNPPNEPQTQGRAYAFIVPTSHPASAPCFSGIGTAQT